MDGAGSQRRVGDHRLCRRVLVQRRFVVVDVHRRHVDGDVGDGHRSDQRDGVHVPRLGDQRRRHRSSIGDNVGDPAHRARCTDRTGRDAALPANGVGSGEVRLSWTAPPNGGSILVDYVVQYSSDGGSSWSTFNDGTSTVTSATVTGLTNGTAYTFRVSAVNAAGTGQHRRQRRRPRAPCPVHRPG